MFCPCYPGHRKRYIALILQFKSNTFGYFIPCPLSFSYHLGDGGRSRRESFGVARMWDTSCKERRCCAVSDVPLPLAGCQAALGESGLRARHEHQSFVASVFRYVRNGAIQGERGRRNVSEITPLSSIPYQYHDYSHPTPSSPSFNPVSQIPIRIHRMVRHYILFISEQVLKKYSQSLEIRQFTRFSIFYFFFFFFF